MTVVGAAFSSEAEARAAEKELAERFALDEGSLERAPLGAVGSPSEGRLIVAARIPSGSVPEASKIIERHGGEIVTEVALPATNDHHLHDVHDVSGRADH
ncbi:MAG: hypothetical protein QOH61_988 [Chloroflexota bacterium]|jgi:hypothetical protein|nr:hypothetical protein [Chloroflexota bacterium]